MHRNSLEAWRTVERNPRMREVLTVLRAAGRAMTDREIVTALGSQDMNYARPAITNLIDIGALAEVEHVRCDVTGRRVRRVWFAPTETKP